MKSQLKMEERPKFFEDGVRFELCPVTAVEGTVLDGFGDMRAHNVFRAVQVADGARYPQNSAVAR
jgi:hypothetical protein